MWEVARGMGAMPGTPAAAGASRSMIRQTFHEIA